MPLIIPTFPLYINAEASSSARYASRRSRAFISKAAGTSLISSAMVASGSLVKQLRPTMKAMMSPETAKRTRAMERNRIKSRVEVMAVECVAYCETCRAQPRMSTDKCLSLTPCTRPFIRSFRPEDPPTDSPLLTLSMTWALSRESHRLRILSASMSDIKQRTDQTLFPWNLM